MTNRNESTRPRAQRREVDNHEGGMRKRRPLNRAPVIRPEGPGCPRLRALTPSAPSAETIYRSWIKRATGEGRPPPGWFRFLRLQTTVDRREPGRREPKAAGAPAAVRRRPRRGRGR